MFDFINNGSFELVFIFNSMKYVIKLIFLYIYDKIEIIRMVRM